MSTVVRTSAVQVTIPASDLFNMLKKHDENVALVTNEMGIPVAVTFENNCLHLFYDKAAPVKSMTRELNTFPS